MKLLLSFIFLATMAFTEKGCKNKKNQDKNCYKGRLEIKANCMNYTISVLEGNIDSGLVEKSWTDENTGKTYNNAFALASKCSFPDSIQQGDEFYFVIDTTTKQDCAVCLMYYPVPQKKLPIKILKDPCP